MLFASIADFKQLALPTAALAGVSDPDIQRALATASARAASFLRQRFRFPLAAWGDDLVEAVCALAAWRILSRRGFNPESTSDAVIRMNHDDAIKWLEAAAKGEVQPDGLLEAPPPDPNDGAAIVISDESRRW